MRALFIILLFGVLITLGNSQKGVVTYYKPNVYIEKGDYYFGKKNFKKAIVYYNMALEKDANYYFFHSFRLLSICYLMRKTLSKFFYFNSLFPDRIQNNYSLYTY